MTITDKGVRQGRTASQGRTIQSGTIALLTSIAATLPMQALAQTITAQATQLPPIIVEGATLAKPQQTAKSKPALQYEAATAPGAKPNKSSKVKDKAGSQQGSVAGAAQAENDVPPAVAPSLQTDQSAAAAGQVGMRTDTLGTAVTVVTGDDIRAQQVRNAGDVLRSLPGVSVNQQGGAGNVSVVRIRGAESNHTLVVIDGVEVNSSIDGFYDFANLGTDDIERIEVLRGPQSGLYGSGALGGVINIVTKSGKGPARVIAEAEAGSFNTRGGRAGVSGGTDTAWGSFMVSSRQTDGFNISPIGNERDGNSLHTLSLKGGVRPFENLTVRGSFRASRLETDYDDFSFNLPGFQMAVDAPFQSRNDMWSGRLEAEYSLFDDAWTQNVFVTRANRDFNDHSFTTSQLIDETTTYGYKTTVRIGPKAGGPVRHYVTGLVEWRDETFDQPTAANFHAERKRTSYVGEVRGHYFGLLNLGATLRRDDNETFDDTTDWRIDGSFKVPSTPFRLHATYGTGTKLPSFAELFGTFSRYTPNPNLQAERSKGWDAGIETIFLGGRGVVDVTYFKADLTNEITEDYSNFPAISSFNLPDESRRQGIEVAGRFKLTAGIMLGASYTWLDARDGQSMIELRRPEHQARFDIDWRSVDQRARLNVAAIYNGEMQDLGFLSGPPFSTRVTLDDYWLLRLSGSYEVAEGVEVFGRVENLLDQDYQEVFGYETAGIAAYAGLRIKLEAPLERAAAWK